MSGWAGSDVGAVRMLAGLELRNRWRRVVVLTLLVGLVGTVVLATIAGARRTDTALARFNSTSRTAAVELTVGDPTPAQLHAFGAVRDVAAFAPLRGIALLFPSAPELAAVAEALDGRFASVVDRARVVSGRPADPKAADEVTIGEGLAAQLHVGVGDHLSGESYTPQQIETCIAANLCSQATPREGPRVQLHIVGIVRRPLDLGDRGASGGVLITTPAFDRKYGRDIGTFGGTILRVRTRHGTADAPRVVDAARRIFGRSPVFSVQDLAIDTQGARSAIDVLTVALWVFAGVAALAGLVTIAIVLSREISSGELDQTTQSALGLTRLQRVAVSGFESVPIALGGALFALVASAGASPLFPIGVARRAEPSPGLRIDGSVLILGALAIVAVVLTIGVLAALRTTRQNRSERVGAGSVAAAVAAASRAGLTPVATTGVRSALEPGRGRTSVPVRSAVVGAVFGVLGVVTVLMLVSSLDRLIASPARYGWTWSFAAVPDTRSAFAPKSPLLHESGIAAVAEVDTANVQLDGHPVQAWGFHPVLGTIDPAVIAGRAPASAGEIALGAATMDELGKHIGDSVHAQGPDGSHTYQIVGRTVFPRLDSPQPLANGGAFTGPGLAAVLNPDNSNEGSPYLVIRAASGADPAAVEHRVDALADIERPFGASVPIEVDRLRHVNWLAVTLAALLTALGLLAVGHALVTSVRRRRRELAILKTLGFERRQIRATVAWQATTLAAIGLVIGIPAGIVIGSVSWRLIANGLGVAPTPVIPTLALLLIIPAALAIVNLITFFPARAAARTRAAVALQSE